MVAPQSKFKAPGDLKGVRFHFMPHGDVLNEAALGALVECGIAIKDIDKGILGLELDTSHISSLEVAKSVVLENAAGVIDEADYNKWPDKGGSLVLLVPSKDQVRVIARTVRVPEGPFVVSKETPEELREQLRHYLLEEVNSKKLVLAALGISSFGPPVSSDEYKPYFELRGRLKGKPPAAAPASRPN